MSAREFHFLEGSSNKCWRIEVSGSSHTVHFARIGSEAEAQKSADKLIAEKVKKGYVEQGASTTPVATAAAEPAPAPKLAKPETAAPAPAPEPATPKPCFLKP